MRTTSSSSPPKRRASSKRRSIIPACPRPRSPIASAALVGLYSSLRQYPKAIEFGNRALKISRDAETQVAVAQAYYQSGNNKEAARVMNELLASVEAQRPGSEGAAAAARPGACSKARDNSCVSRVFEKLVVVLPEARILAAAHESAAPGRHR